MCEGSLTFVRACVCVLVSKIMVCFIARDVFAVVWLGTGEHIQTSSSGLDYYYHIQTVYTVSIAKNCSGKK